MKGKKNKPDCRLNIYETKAKDYYWQIFRKHHYLNHSHNNASRVFVATLNDDLCAFVSVLTFPHPIVKNMKRIHRIVVLPDYQGMGIAQTLLNRIGEMLKNEGYRTSIITSNMAMVMSLKHSGNWKCHHIGRFKGSYTGKIQNLAKKGSLSNARITVGFEYAK